MFEHLRKKLDITGFDYKDYRAYKICDFKPTFGHVFSDYLYDYDYWGYIDPDAIVGNLDSYLSAENLENHDVISGGEKQSDWISGALSQYRVS